MVDDKIRFYILEVRRGPYDDDYDWTEYEDMSTRFKDIPGFDKLRKKFRTKSDWELHRIQLAIIRKKYGRHWREFGMAGPTISRHLGRAKDVGSFLNSVIGIGEVIHRIISVVSSWTERYSRYLEKRREKKTLTLISKGVEALVVAIQENKPKERKKIEITIRANALFQGIYPIKRILVAEIVLLFGQNNLDNEINKTIKNAIKNPAHKLVTEITRLKGKTVLLEEVIESNLHTFARNFDKYAKTFRLTTR